VRELGPWDRPAAWLDEPTSDAVASGNDETAAHDVAALPAPARVQPRSEVAAPAWANQSQSEAAAPARVQPRSEVAAPAWVDLSGSEVAAPARVDLSGSEVAAPARANQSQSEAAAPARAQPQSEVAAPARVDLSGSEFAAPGAPVRSGLRSATTFRAPSSSVTGPQRYRVQFSAGEEYVELVERAQALLSHAAPNDSLENLHVRAMRALVVELEKRRYAVTEEPRNAPAKSAECNTEHGAERERSRAVPAEIRRAVFERDGGRCTYVDGRGRRCRETRRIELHHVEPFAHGGVHHVTNVRLCCRAHNALAAEEDFGRSFILKRKDGARHESAASQACRPDELVPARAT
jgi:hypothetical protein